MKKAVAKVFLILSVLSDIIALVTAINGFTINTTMLLILFSINIVLLISVVALVIEKRRIKLLGTISVDNIDLTVINQKNLTRKKIKTLEANGIKYKYIFFNNGFEAFISYKGQVRKQIGTVSGIDLNFSGDSNQTNDSIDAYAFDLIEDPEKNNPIKGRFSPRSGLNKEVFFKFERPLKKGERFDYLFHYRWDNCLNPDKDYVAFIPAFEYINPNLVELEVVFNNMTVTSFQPYSINNYKVKEEERQKPIYDDGEIQIFKHNFILQEDFNFGLAVFYFW